MYMVKTYKKARVTLYPNSNDGHFQFFYDDKMSRTES